MILIFRWLQLISVSSYSELFSVPLRKFMNIIPKSIDLIEIKKSECEIKIKNALESQGFGSYNYKSGHILRLF